MRPGPRVTGQASGCSGGEPAGLQSPAAWEEDSLAETDRAQGLSGTPAPRGRSQWGRNQKPAVTERSLASSHLSLPPRPHPSRPQLHQMWRKLHVP